MDKKIYLLIVEDELEVMDALVKDLEKFEPFFPLETANDAVEAEQVIEDIISEGNSIGLILCDHVLPGKNGVDLLIEMRDNPETSDTKKILVTGQAGHEDTILAINKADLDHYIAKPWSREELEESVVRELTDYVIEKEKNLLPFMQILDSEKLSEAMRKKQMGDR
ncbi:response regulator [Gracilimonas mengyeensis]|uniref:Response regulator receiver domain-containing protein n=1 Tax=Gracilimonas mengyeensis TaxID=1302730 RepID=A0A521CGP5_9BACT|nr:response regulator [Gracilimonas mengyeensis]SMO58604.1 Response regulator receiver domain-containing protein [Gracilimonas mengyeensis]